MIRNEQIAGLVGAGALALILGALCFQYLQHLPPCEMCHWQRWPHIAAAALGLIGVSRSDRLATGTVALGAVVALTAAAQWGMLTSWQPKLLILISGGLAAAALWKKDVRTLAMTVIALVAISGLIGAYQAGMQWGALPGPSGCTVAHAYVLGSGAPPPAVNCNVVTWRLLGLSLAAYNAIFSFLIAGTGAFLLGRKHAA
ncbi:MAG: disulfide bond formation protein B [Alphaproteobacteria bacterium]|nr:disulfide bond formation protein B [Alphaproteobacteria bacterium]